MTLTRIVRVDFQQTNSIKKNGSLSKSRNKLSFVATNKRNKSVLLIQEKGQDQPTPLQEIHATRTEHKPTNPC
jgi:hypothetical protein